MRTSRKGFTLIEMTVATGLLGVVMGSALMMTVAGRSAFEEAAQRQQAESTVRRALERVVLEMQWAESDGLSPDCSAGSPTVTFQPLVGVAGGAAVWGDSRRIARVASANDADDGLDNDGDGVIDEGDLVMTIDPGGPDEFSVTLCTQVTEMAPGETLNGIDDDGNGVIDERGFNVEALGNLITLRLSVAQPTSGNTVTMSSITTSITLRT